MVCVCGKIQVLLSGFFPLFFLMRCADNSDKLSTDWNLCSRFCDTACTTTDIKVVVVLIFWKLLKHLRASIEATWENNVDTSYDIFVRAVIHSGLRSL